MFSAPLQSRPAPSEPQVRSPRVLLVDDDQTVLRGVVRVLRAARPKWELAVANSTRSAQIELFDRQFDVVVTELEMSGTDGLELIELVAHHCPEVSCVVHSARIDRFVGHPSLARVTALIRKPAAEPHLIGTLNDALWASVTARRHASRPPPPPAEPAPRAHRPV